LIDTLVTLANRLQCRPVLILTDDQSVNAVSAFRDRILPLYRISLPTLNVVQALSDKNSFHALAEREGFAVPRAIALEGSGCVALLSSLRPPLILKPADKTLVLKGTVERAVLARNLTEAETAARRMLAVAPRVIAQEWIEGPDEALFFTLFTCDGDGRVLGLFCGRKLVCSPPGVGNTAVCVAAPEVSDDLNTLTLSFIERVRYRGLGSLEFKRETETGRFLMIEPTVGRTDWQEEIATLCDVNLPLLTYRAELGQPTAHMATSRGATAIWRSSVAFRVPNTALGLSARITDGFFRWSDPLPGLYYYGYERGFLRLWHRVSRTLRR
jgi:D-aspartate ligase